MDFSDEAAVFDKCLNIIKKVEKVWHTRHDDLERPAINVYSLLLVLHHSAEHLATLTQHSARASNQLEGSGMLSCQMIL